MKAIRARTEADGVHIVSSTVFLTDTSRCAPRDGSPDLPRLVRDYDLTEVFTDEVLATRFNADLLRLLAQVHQRRNSVSPLTTTRANAGPSEDRWGD